MRILCCSVLLLCSITLNASPAALLPVPAQLQLQPGTFDLSAGLTIDMPANNAVVHAGAARFKQRLRQQTALPLPKSATQRLHLQLTGEHTAALNDSPAPGPKMNEQYQLNVTPQQITLSAPTEIGILRGLETLLQLAADGTVPALKLMDKPRFSWRGLLLDPARRFLPLPTLKRQLDIMAAVKLNVLHLHLTDDQGWRFESKRFPKLHQVGGRQGYYTQEQLKELVQYAAERGIRVVPEIDLPGHTTALGAAYPQWMSQPGSAQPERHWGVHPAVLDPTNEQLYVFLTELIAEVAAVFPDPYLHIGGDEVMSDHWLATPHIVKFMQQHKMADTAALHGYFNRRLHKILQQSGRTMMGWDEIADSALPQSVLVQSWRGTESLQQAAAAGYDTILSTGYYLDQPQFASYHYRNDPIAPASAEPDLSQLQHWSAWQFSFPRLRGSAIHARLALLNMANGKIQGVLEFSGRPSVYLQNLVLDANRLSFTTDSWMGPLSASITFGKALSGNLVVGNAPYPLTGSALAVQQPLLTALPLSLPANTSGKHNNHILGGEIALWGELVTPDNIDIRLWPNGFAVAERLWSDAAVRDEDSLYQRLATLTQQLQDHHSLQLAQQQEKGFAALVNTQAATLAIASQVLEPAHYYHRLHQKSAAGIYHQGAPLNQLVDYLSAEHPQLRRFAKTVQQWLEQPEPEQAAELKQQLQHWQNAANSLVTAQNATPALYLQLLKQVSALCQSGHLLLDSIAQRTPLSIQARAKITAQLQSAATINQEIIIALHRPLQQLLDHAAHSDIWVSANTFSAAVEGPAVDNNGNLYAVNFGRDGTVGKVSSSGKASLYLTLPTGSTGNGIVFDHSGTMYIADYTGHNILRYQDSKLSVHANNKAMHQPNDLAILPNGTLYASDPNWSDNTGQLWRIATDGSTELLFSDMGTTNGIAVSPDQQFLYVNESIQRRIWRFRINADNSLSDKQLFASFSHFGLDGMRTDSEGNLYVARYGKGVVAKLDSEGQLIQEYRLNNTLPTNVSLNHDETALYVTIQQCGCIERIAL